MDNTAMRALGIAERSRSCCIASARRLRGARGMLACTPRSATELAVGRLVSRRRRPKERSRCTTCAHVRCCPVRGRGYTGDGAIRSCCIVSARRLRGARGMLACTRGARLNEWLVGSSAGGAVTYLEPTDILQYTQILPHPFLLRHRQKAMAAVCTLDESDRPQSA